MVSLSYCWNRLKRFLDPHGNAPRPIKLGGHNRVNSAVFSHDGKFLICGTGYPCNELSEGQVVLWRVATRKRVRKAITHPLKITSVAFSRDGRMIAYGTGGLFGDLKKKVWPPRQMAGEVKICDPMLSTELACLQEEGSVTSLDFSPDGSMLASGITKGNVSLWDMTTLQQIGVLPGVISRIKRVAFSPEGATLAVARNLEDRTSRIDLWDVSSKQLLQTLDMHSGEITSLAFFPGGNYLVSGGQDGSVVLTDLSTWQSKWTVSDTWGGTIVSVLADGRVLTISADKGIRFLDPETGSQIVSAKLPLRHWFPFVLTAVAVSADGKNLVSCESPFFFAYEMAQVKLWDLDMLFRR